MVLLQRQQDRAITWRWLTYCSLSCLCNDRVWLISIRLCLTLCCYHGHSRRQRQDTFMFRWILCEFERSRLEFSVYNIYRNQSAWNVCAIVRSARQGLSDVKELICEFFLVKILEIPSQKKGIMDVGSLAVGGAIIVVVVALVALLLYFGSGREKTFEEVIAFSSLFE